jgi:hypothetical protein
MIAVIAMGRDYGWRAVEILITVTTFLVFDWTVQCAVFMQAWEVHLTGVVFFDACTPMPTALNFFTSMLVFGTAFRVQANVTHWVLK